MQKYNLKSFLGELWHGKTIGRTLFNKQVSNSVEFIGENVLDIGAGINPSYKKYLPKKNYTNTDIKTGEGTIFLDANKKFEIEDSKYDTVFLFNSLYIYEDANFTISEISRVLKQTGTFLLSSPFCMQEIAEPHDYVRYTGEGLEKLLKQNNFEILKLVKVGNRFVTSASLLHDVFYLSIIRIFVYSVAIFLDKIFTNKFKKHPSPLSYFVVARKV